MKTKTKPKGGCQQRGFTYIDDGGQFVQISWKDLKTRGEMLHKLDGNTWRVVHKIDGENEGGLNTYAIGPKGAAPNILATAAQTLPTSLLRGHGIKAVSRLRELAALDPIIVHASETWALVKPPDRRLLRMLWNEQTKKETANHIDNITDLDILNYQNAETRHPLGDNCEGLHATPLYGKRPNSILNIPTAVATLLHSLPSDRDSRGMEVLQDQITALIYSKISDGTIGERHVEDILTVMKMYAPADRKCDLGRGLAEQAINLLSEFKDSDTPLTDMLHAIFEIPIDTREVMFDAMRLLNTYTVNGGEARHIAKQIHATTLNGEKRQVLTNMIETRLCVTRGDITDAETAITMYSKSPGEAVRKYGTVDTYLTTTFPALDIACKEAFASQLWLGLEDNLTEKTLQTLDRFEPKIFAATWALISSHKGDGTIGNIPDVAGVIATVGAVGTFGKRAPEWLLQNADSKRISDIRRQQALPDETATRKRINALTALQTTLQTTPPLTISESAKIEHKKTMYSNLLNGLRRQQIEALLTDPNIANRTELAVELATLTATTIQETLATIGNDEEMLQELLPNAAKANKQNNRIDGGDTTEGDVLLGIYVKALKRKDSVSALQTGREILGRTGTQILPPTKVLRQRLAALTQQSAPVDMVAITENLDLWKRYQIALCAGDENEMLRLNDILNTHKVTNTLDRYRKDSSKRPETYNSVHDTTYWLVADPRATTAPDGTQLGDWLLTNGRGKDALKSETGRRSLEIAVKTFARYGNKQISLKQLSNMSNIKAADPDIDESSRFFARERISAHSAQLTIDMLRQSVNTPTLLPLTDLYQDTKSGMRGYFLGRNDTRGMQLGILTGCCQHPDSTGRHCAIAGQTHPSSGFFVVENSEGKIVAQSWMWAGADGNGAGIVFDNIETLHLDSDKRNAVRLIYEQAADVLAERFDRVLIGDNNDIDVSDLQKTNNPLRGTTIDYHGHTDAKTQRYWHGKDKNTTGYGLLFPQTATGDPLVKTPVRRVSESKPVERQIRFQGRPKGFEITDGTNTVTVHSNGDITLTGDGARQLAETELTKMTTRTYRCVDKNRKPTGETVNIKTTPHHGWNIDIATLPETYDALSPAINTLLQEGGIPTQARRAWYDLANGDLDLAICMFKTGWTATSYQTLIKDFGQRSALLYSAPEALRKKGTAVLQKEYIKDLQKRHHQPGGQKHVNTFLQNPHLKNITGHTGVATTRDRMTVILPAIHARPDVNAVYELTAKIVKCLTTPRERSEEIVLALRALKIANEITEAGLDSAETEVLLSGKCSLKIGNKMHQVSSLHMPEVRQEWYNLTPKVRTQIRETQLALGMTTSTFR